MNSSHLTPVAGDERVELIDILRGFALLGILIVNFWGNSGEGVRAIDQFVSEVLETLVSGSFYPLFSFLFGLGFAVQLLRARERGAAVIPVYIRRLLALFLIGAFHAIVIWNGDILRFYSILGLALVLLHRLPDRVLLALAAVPLVVGLWGQPVRHYLDSIGGDTAAESRMLNTIGSNERDRLTANIAHRYELDSTATRLAAFTSALESRWQNYKRSIRGQFSRDFFLDDIPAFFLIGFVVGRKRILQEASKHRTGLRVAALIGFLAAVLGALLNYVWKPESDLLQGVAWRTSNYGTTMLYISAIALGVTFRPAFERAFRVLAPAGRIGLTNYLLQSTTMTLVFSTYGLSLQRPTTSIWLLVNLVFYFGVQIPLSHWWVRQFRFGPAEWVWRSLTYGTPQPMRLVPARAGSPDLQPIASS
jgi:uncharacterized protein